MYHVLSSIANSQLYISVIYCSNHWAYIGLSVPLKHMTNKFIMAIYSSESWTYKEGSLKHFD